MVIEGFFISTQVEKKIIKQVDIVTIVTVHVCLTGENGVCLD